MRLPATLDENALRAIGVKAHPAGFSIVHIYDEGELAEFEISPDLPLGIDGRPEGYDDALATIAVPVVVSSAQAKIQLSRTPGAEAGATLLDDVTTAVKAAGIEAQIWFAEARTWERSNPYVADLSGPSGLKLTSAQVDELFIEAAKIAA